MNRVGVLDEVMEGLDFEEEDGDRDEGEVDDVILGEQEVVGETDQSKDSWIAHAVTCKRGLHLGFLIQMSVDEIAGLFFVEEYFE